MNKEYKMKSAYEIAETLLRNNERHCYVKEITDLSYEVLSKLNKKLDLTLLIEKVLDSFKNVKDFFEENNVSHKDYRYDGSLSPKAIELMRELKEVLEFEKALLPFPTEETKETELSPREKEIRELAKKLPKIGQPL